MIETVYNNLNMVKTIITTIIFIVTFGIAIYVYFVPPNNNNNFDYGENKNIPKNFKYEDTNIHPPVIKSGSNNKLCSVLDSVTGSKSGTKEFETEYGRVSVDCYDEQNKLAVDYKNEQEYNYTKNDIYNKNVYHFYSRLFTSNVKEYFFGSNGIDYIKVPYLVSDCYKFDGQFICDKNTSDNIKNNRVENYLRESILQLAY